MQSFQDNTCIRFTPRSGQSDYIHIAKWGQGCSSYVGRAGGEQSLSLDNGCTDERTMLHELMHALGFFHEHTRSDRDDYLTINFGNIMT
ncbi:unnamed protein product, partial [Darwinula stevensoni]